MELKSLAAVQEKSTIETAEKITKFLRYCASHPYAVTEYRRITMILNIY